MTSSRLATLLDDVSQRGAEWQPLYDRFVAHLRSAGVGVAAPATGERFPAFGLPDSRGRYVRSSELLERGPLVLSFNRGAWCPYCRSELSAWGLELAQLERCGAAFVAVTGEVGGRAERLRRDIGPAAEMLCDVDHGLALRLGLAFPLSAEMRRAYLAHGLDLAEVYGTASWFLPVPATFVLDREGVVRFSFVDPDFRVRAEPEAVLAALREMTHGLAGDPAPPGGLGPSIG